jgi:hypothetical protein
MPSVDTVLFVDCSNYFALYAAKCRVTSEALPPPHLKHRKYGNVLPHGSGDICVSNNGGMKVSMGKLEKVGESLLQYEFRKYRTRDSDVRNHGLTA